MEYYEEDMMTVDDLEEGEQLVEVNHTVIIDGKEYVFNDAYSTT